MHYVGLINDRYLVKCHYRFYESITDIKIYIQIYCLIKSLGKIPWNCRTIQNSQYAFTSISIALSQKQFLNIFCSISAVNSEHLFASKWYHSMHINEACISIAYIIVAKLNCNPSVFRQKCQKPNKPNSQFPIVYNDLTYVLYSQLYRFLEASTALHCTLLYCLLCALQKKAVITCCFKTLSQPHFTQEPCRFCLI